ncbi:hypothetical protein KR018_002186 [Drosophila ironensis]|nr:hypothetical protein KR018_002186 [Drosophila ironensis]
MRNRNIIKDSVRASFNIDSSVENSTHSTDIVVPSKIKKSERIFCDKDTKLAMTSLSISTPCHKNEFKNLFQCGLSPITCMKQKELESNYDNTSTKLLDSVVKKRVSFENISTIESNALNFNCLKKLPKIAIDDVFCEKRTLLKLEPGKWRKSLKGWRRTLLEPKLSKNDPYDAINLRPIIPTSGGRKTILKKHSNIDGENLKPCPLKNLIPFYDEYAASKMLNTKKIGEGAYGEVFRYSTKSVTNMDVVLKIIPIEGSTVINGEMQKSYHQIFPEILITKKMHSLRTNDKNVTNGFANLNKVTIVKGKYPKHLIKLWECYDDENTSENDHPKIFDENQIFLIFELKYAGNDMSHYAFKNAEQSYYVLLQILLTLAIGEEAYQFEHRDLHWGNILLKEINEPQVSFKLNGRNYLVKSKGVNVTIIDYTLSRISIDECYHFNDLSSDEELFSATGDYQFDIYRMMRAELKNDWSSFAPKTNIFWLSYVVAKLIDGVKYKSADTKLHKMYMQKLKKLKNIILTFQSAVHCVKYLFK